MRLGALLGSPASALFVPSQGPVLAKPDLEEDQEQPATQPHRDQPDREYLAGQSLDQDAAQGARDSQPCGQPERKDAHARSHARTNRLLRLHESHGDDRAGPHRELLPAVPAVGAVEEAAVGEPGEEPVRRRDEGVGHRVDRLG
jgi:hypothetical protein